VQITALGRDLLSQARHPNPVVSLSLDLGSEARAILHHLLENGDLAGRDAVGRTLITLAVDDRLLKRPLTFGAAVEDLEDGDDEN
jgi:hypothetical protein